MSAEGGGLRGQWRLLAAVGAVATVGAFVGVRVAGAVTPGARGGSTRTALAVAGSLTGVAGPTARATFVFRNAGGVRCTPPEVSVRLEAGGGFREEIDLTDCSAALFDGSDVSVDVQVNGANVITGQPIAPVPYARYAEQYGTPDCPVGYRRVEESGFPATGRLCQRFSTTGSLADVVVRVGDGASAFWIDRYEASVWSDANGTLATTLADGRVVPWGEGTRMDDYPASFPKNGQWTVPLYAVSRPNVSPSAHITWFQAAAACRNSGKRLPSGEEWLAAARGTRDPGVSDGASGECITSGSPRNSSPTPRCSSAAGAQDMIGNFWEWTGEWYATSLTSVAGDVSSYWQTQGGASFGDDGVFNVTSAVFPNNGGSRVVGLPAAVFRGGSAGNGVRSGTFAMNLNAAPSVWGELTSFRCVIPR